jgi:hypothetical protein
MREAERAAQNQGGDSGTQQKKSSYERKKGIDLSKYDKSEQQEVKKYRLNLKQRLTLAEKAQRISPSPLAF